MNDPGIRGITALIREHRSFRYLWFGQIVSQLGDWINHVAILTLLLELTGSGEMIAWSLILRMLPTVFVAPFAGVIVDRFDRRRIMILSDVLRAAMVPLFLFARDPSFVPLIFSLLVLQVCVSAFFEPARQALLPSIVSREQLLSANALMSVTWSVSLAAGSALGGLLIGSFGIGCGFIIDAVTFLASAILLLGVRQTASPRTAVGRSWYQGFAEMSEGLRYMWHGQGIRSLVLVKSGVGLAGGMVLLLTVFGERVFPVGTSASYGIGILFLARGIGTAIGPFVGRSISGYHEPSMRRLIGFGFIQGGLFLIVFSQTPVLWLAFLVLVLAHVGTSIDWVFSTVLLQLKVPEEMRGRVFSAELALFTVVFGLVTLGIGYSLDRLEMSPRLLAAISGGALLLPGLLWMMIDFLKGRGRDREERSGTETPSGRRSTFGP